MAKRSREEGEELDVSEIDSPLKRATVHGVITELSPIKLSRGKEKKYFSGSVSDGKEEIRLIAFCPELRDDMETSRIEGSTIALVNCEIQKMDPKYVAGNKPFEVVLSNYSNVRRSLSKKFGDIEKKTAVPIPVSVKLDSIDDYDVNQRLSVLVKVLSVAPSETITSKIGKVFTKQEVRIGDVTGRCRLVLWESDVDRLVIDKCYRLESVYVKMFDDKKYLTMSAQGNVQEIEDIGIIAEESDKDPSAMNGVEEGYIIGVVKTDEYVSCIGCKSKVEAVTDVSGKCEKCGMMVKLSFCDINNTAMVVFRNVDGKQRQVKLFHKEIVAIVHDTPGVSLAEKFLNAPKVKLCINNKDIVYSASTPSGSDQ